MNKITRKRPDTMYMREEIYRKIGIYTYYSIKEHLRRIKKKTKKYLKFRSRQSGRCSIICGITQLIEVNDYGKRKNDSN